MQEEEFDALMNAHPFGTEDATRLDAQLRGEFLFATNVGSALWGRTSADLQRQLLAPHPEIPPGLDLADLRKLLIYAGQMNLAVLAAQRLRGLPPGVLPPPAVFVGTQGFALWEARFEIVRRAIDYLERR